MAMLSAPLLAVIVPVYRVEPYLRQCIDSILGQSYTHLRLILVDDGSPDSCGAICDEYASVDDRVIVVHKANGGLSDARNVALEYLGVAEYVTFVDSDDWVEPGLYEQCIMELDTHPEYAIVGYGYRRVLPDGTEDVLPERHAYTSEEALRLYVSCSSPIVAPPVWAKVYRRSVIEGITFVQGHKWEDVTYTLQVLWQSKGGYLVLPIIGVNYRIQRPGAITDSTLPDRTTLFEDLEALMERNSSSSDFIAYANTLLVQCMWMHARVLRRSRSYHAELGRYLPYLDRMRKRPYLRVHSSNSRWLKCHLFYLHPRAMLALRRLSYRLTH